MNGIAPAWLAEETYGGASYLVISACCSLVGVCRVVYWPVDGSGMLVCISTGVNVRYLLAYEEPWKVNVEILDGVSVVEECTVLSPEKVPNRLSATIIDQRSAAQYGQYSAPMYSISGLPPEVRGVPPLTGWILPVNEPLPTLSSVLAGTFVTLDTTLARAAPVGPFDELVAGLLFALITMKATTTAITAMMLPDAMRIRRRCSARRSAARCAAIFSLRLASTFVLLALPMLASSNPCVSQLAATPRVCWFHACASAQQ